MLVSMMVLSGLFWGIMATLGHTLAERFTRTWRGRAGVTATA